MSDDRIPEDVFHIANEAYEAYASGDGKDIRECIARAILAERNRCAMMAREYPLTDIFEAHKNRAVACNASQNIADMIGGKLAIYLRDEV